MTINYGLTRIGCQKKLYLLLKEYKYCLDWADFKNKWLNEVNKFYSFLENLPFVKNLQYLQEIWNYFCDNNIVYQFVIGEDGLLINNDNNIFIQKKIDNDFIFKSKTISYKKYYKNLSLYNKSRKMKEKGFKYLWHYKKIDKRNQKRKVKANLIHMLDGTWNILICNNFVWDIASIHDCHGIHSCYVDEYLKSVKQVLIKMFNFNNQYYNLLINMLMFYEDSDKEYLKKHINNNFQKYFVWNFWKWWSIRHSKYMFVTK
jgi:hypothetical protein